jgi:hypothetical protein
VLQVAGYSVAALCSGIDVHFLLKRVRFPTVHMAVHNSKKLAKTHSRTSLFPAAFSDTVTRLLTVLVDQRGHKAAVMCAKLTNSACSHFGENVP